MTNIKGIDARPINSPARDLEKADKRTNFGAVLSKIADGALDTVSAVGSALPGGTAISAAAKGLKAIKNHGETLDTREQLDRMWEMQRENQQYNLEYLEMQTSLQADNRRFTTVSNLMKARHDTAKAAINNMKV